MTRSQPADRIAFFLPNLGGGGAERVTLNLARGMTTYGKSVDLVLTNATGPYCKNVDPAVRVIDLAVGRTIAAIPALVAYLRREKPEALIAALDHANLVALMAAGLAGGQTVTAITLHTNLSQALENRQLWRSSLTPALARRIYPQADAIIAVSQGIVQDYATVCHIAPERIDVAYNPVVTDQLLLNAQESLLHPWFRPGTPPVILAVGRLTTPKDYDTLIRAFAILRKSVACRLLILGEGELRPQLEVLVQELGLNADVAMPGFTDNPYPYMAQCRLFVMSSIYEALPTVMIEAMACGAAVVSTNCPYGPEEILQGGLYGKLVPVRDPAALAEAMHGTLAESPNAEAVKKRAADFTEERATLRYLDILDAARRRKQIAAAG